MGTLCADQLLSVIKILKKRKIKILINLFHKLHFWKVINELRYMIKNLETKTLIRLS